MPARDPGQRLAGLVQRQHRLDLGTQRARVHKAAECIQPLPAAVGGERFAGDAPLQLGGRTLQDDGDHPAAVADRADGLVAGLAPGAVQQQVDAAGNLGSHLLDPVRGVVVEHRTGAQAPQVVMVARAGHAQRSGAQRRRDLHGRAAHPSGGGGDEHGLARLQPAPVHQALVAGPTADHQPGRLGEACPAGHRGQAVRRRQRQFGKPAPRREQGPVHPLARLDTGPVTGRFDQAGDFLPRDERQGNPRETAAEEPDVPRADTRAMDPHKHLPHRGYRVWQLPQL